MYFIFRTEVWAVSQLFLCLKMMRLRLSISYCFIWTGFSKEYEVCFVKSFHSALHLTMFMRWMICKGLYKIFDRSSTPLANPRLTLTLGYFFGMWEHAWHSACLYVVRQARGSLPQIFHELKLGASSVMRSHIPNLVTLFLSPMTLEKVPISVAAFQNFGDYLWMIIRSL